MLLPDYLEHYPGDYHTSEDYYYSGAPDLYCIQKYNFLFKHGSQNKSGEADVDNDLGYYGQIPFLDFTEQETNENDNKSRQNYVKKVRQISLLQVRK
jgi:hypothetical protein